MIVFLRPIGSKADTPFGALPVLKVDGQIVAQSNAINRYVGKLADLYPSDPWQAALCDEAMEAVEDITTKLVATRALSGRAKESTAQGAGRRPNPILSHTATAAARSTWRPVIRRRPIDRHRSQGLRVNPKS